MFIDDTRAAFLKKISDLKRNYSQMMDRLKRFARSIAGHESCVSVHKQFARGLLTTLAIPLFSKREIKRK